MKTGKQFLWFPRRLWSEKRQRPVWKWLTTVTIHKRQGFY